VLSTDETIVNDSLSLDDVCVNELCDVTVSNEFVLKTLRTLDTTKAVGIDNMSPVLLKECCNELCESLCLLFNKSFKEGVFPDEWKKARIVPIHKAKDEHDVSNYRPVSLLSIVSKVAER
jgi:hypothetical protein